MTENEELIDPYQELQHKLTTANASADASEVHGVICGVIASNQELPVYWFAELFDQAEEGDLLAADCRSEVEELYTNTIRKIEDAGVGMKLLLPDDENSLTTRAKAVSQWCQGFLYGIGLSGDAFEQQLSNEAREALEDIEVAELVDHTYYWLKIPGWLPKRSAKKTGEGVWSVDGKLQMQILGGSAEGEVVEGGLLGAVRRDFTARKGETLLDTACVYQSIVPGRPPVEVTGDASAVTVGKWTVRRGEGAAPDLVRGLGACAR